VTPFDADKLNHLMEQAEIRLVLACSRHNVRYLTGDYLADICRMGCLGEPSTLARDLHGACIEVQESVRGLVRAGLPGRELLREGERAVRAQRFAEYGRFVAHGIGMVSHEQPILTPDDPRPLEAGMILSIETDIIHPEVGHVKIEDAVAVTETECEGLGDQGRDWHLVRS
jgi:Xaa-Pro dipeptidase